MEKIILNYDKIYHIHDNGYSHGGREINFAGSNLDALTTLMDIKYKMLDVPVEIECNVTDVLIRNGEIVEKRRAMLDDNIDERIVKMLNIAVKDYLDESSFIGEIEDYFIGAWIARKGEGLIAQYALLFIMSLLQFIIEDAGIGKGRPDDDNHGRDRKVVAKIYREYDDRYLDYEKQLNSFSFYVPEKMWQEGFDEWRKTGNFFLPYSMYDIDSTFILERLVPAFYYSLMFMTNPDERVFDFYDYEFEVG